MYIHTHIHTHIHTYRSGASAESGVCRTAGRGLASEGVYDYSLSLKCVYIYIYTYKYIH